MQEATVTTRSGTVRGAEGDQVTAFLGIPYAAPPTGPSRFLPPGPAPSWSGVRDASSFGFVAPQTVSSVGGYVPGDPLAQDEDCLSVNVWAPNPRTGRLPVMVFVHGGAFMNGAGSSLLYRPERLARVGAVVVTFNYRLGALGFLAHPVLADATSRGFGNWGLFDQIAALGWVRDNIAGFGGDPDNITLFGESAGAMAVCDLLSIAHTRSLIRRAIVQSGAPLASAPPAAARVAERLFDLLGIEHPDRRALSSVPIDELIAAQSELNGEIDAGIGLPFQPVVDGGLLSTAPEVAIAAGSSAGVDLLCGWNRDEFALFSFAALSGQEFGPSDLETLVGRYLGGAGLDAALAPSVISAYRTARDGRGEVTSDRALLDAIVTDWIFRIPLLRLAEAHAAHTPSTYVYEFDWSSPFAGGALGACHGIELPFVFGSVHEPIVGLFAGSGEEAFALCDTVQEAWVAFAAGGDPSTQRLGAWPHYNSHGRETMRLGAEIEVVASPRETERSFWDEHLGRYGVDGPIEGARRLGVSLLAPEEDEHSGA